LFTPARLDQPELLDEHDAPRADMERSLRDLRRINRYLGGASIYKRLLRRLGRVESVLDIGAGSAELVSSLPDDVTRIALDFKIDHLMYLRDRRAIRVVGDATRLPFRAGSVDAVTSAHFFHHFSPDENVAILGEALRVARRGVAVNDTRRHYVPLLFVRLLAAFRLVGRITRFDAPASVLRGYTVEEVRAIGDRMRSRAEVRRVWPFRFGLLLWK
jgi:ubiquinone/menaquinone biosynthesis C-methylase UbiE